MNVAFTLPSVRINPLFDMITKENAKEFFDTYMANKEAALDSLAHDVNLEGLELDFSPESLTPLWQWAQCRYQYGDEHPSIDKVPIWYYPERVNNRHFGGAPLTIEAAKVQDQVAYYFAEVVVRNLPEMKWGLYMKGGSPYSYRPILVGAVPAYPINTVGNVLTRVLINSPHASSDALKESFDLYKKKIEEGNAN